MLPPSLFTLESLGSGRPVGFTLLSMPETKPAKRSAKKIVSKPAAKAPSQKTAALGSTTAAKTRRMGGDLAPERIAAILRALDEAYPNAVCALDHKTPWELLVATILSAQCTDVRVNMVTPELFRRFPTTGFFRNKAKSIKGAAQAVVERFGGQIPRTLAELITVPGAARKTANVVLGVSYGLAEGVVVDTHVFRITRRLNLAKGDTPEKVEQELMRVLPRDKWIDFSHQVIHHGRQVCVARNPKCNVCNLEQLCHSKDKTWHS